MDLDLDVVDYMQVGITDIKCMKILPNNEKRRLTQKVVVGDKDGVLQCFGMKNKELSSIFKLLPGAPITRVELGGALETVQDKIFVTSGAEIRAYSRKGKKFLDFNSNLTENIANVCISGSDLIVGGLYIYNHFSDCVDQGYYLANDKINDILVLPVNRKEEEKFTSVLACNDKILRVLEGFELKYEVEVPGAPQTVIALPFTNDDGFIEIVYGTTDGKIGHVMLTDGQPVYKWEIPNDSNLGGVSCMSHYDITGAGVGELLVGRDDGTVQIFSFDDLGVPVLRFTHNFSDSITSIQGGVVGTLGFPEVLVSTYSGWISGLTTEHQQKQTLQRDASTKQGATVTAVNKNADAKIEALRAEVDALERKVQAEKSKHMDRTSRVVATGDTTVTKATTFHVNDKFYLSSVDSSYHLSIEVQAVIDYIVLQSDVPIDLLDVEKTPAVVSYTTPASKNPNTENNFMLATYRCQGNSTRLELKIRSIEGQFGYIQAYVIPTIQPKTSVLRRYQIKPLSLHQRTHSIDEQRPMNVLKLTGPFSLAEIHSWVVFCLPDMPDRTPAGDQITYYFVNTFLETQLECTYKKGEGTFSSDNISTISILKDILTKEATSKKVTLNIQYQVNEDSIPYTLQLLHPKLDHQLMLAKKVQLLDALQELQVHEGNMDFLAPEYQLILEEAEQIKTEFLQQPARLERLYGMVTDLFIDKYKFKGVNVKQKVALLLETLDNYDLPSLISFFQQSVY